MDDTDRKLPILILANPRIHLQELARRLGISRQALHHRMRNLAEAGVIRGTTASVSVPYLDAIPVVVFGRSRAGSIEDILNRLGENELSRRVVVAGGNFLYVIGFLRNISELDSYAEFVKQTAEMSEPTVGIYSSDDGLMPNYIVDGTGKRKPGYEKLSPLDLRIIAALKDDARRPIADIAHMVGVSAKTVQRHLEDMISEGSVDFHVLVDTTLGGDMFLLMHVNLRDGANKGEVGKRILSRHPFQDAYIRTFSNLPNLIVLVFWSDSITEIRKVLVEVSEDEDVGTVMLNFAYLERLYTTWLDKLLEVQTRPSKKPRTRNLHSGLGTQ